MKTTAQQSQNTSAAATFAKRLATCLGGDIALDPRGNSRRRLALLAAGGLAAAAAVGSVLATPGSGAAGTVMARAWFTDEVDIKIKLRDELEIFHVPSSAETVMQRIVVAPNGHTGWHSHPGPAIALVTSGELTLYSEDDPSCAGHTYTAGQAFVDSGQGHSHLARNLRSDQQAEVWVTYLDVTQGAVRIDAADPGFCPF
jgi:quercetin dioxygenase-like cupin family protein